jgi:predicted alpha/beta hydrolase family esterase
MKNAIILHGRPGKTEFYSGEFPSASNSHWLPWLQKQLLIKDIKSDTPEIPHSYEPRWDLWVKEVERFEIGPDTLLVGHSTGSGFIVKYLSIHPELRVGKVILVAPWLDPDNNETEGFFSNFEIDAALVNRTSGIIIFNSDDDQIGVQKSTKILRDKVKNIGYREFHKHGHFCYRDLKTNAFPELLEECLKGNN